MLKGHAVKARTQTEAANDGRNDFSKSSYPSVLF